MTSPYFQLDWGRSICCCFFIKLFIVVTLSRFFFFFHSFNQRRLNLILYFWPLFPLWAQKKCSEHKVILVAHCDNTRAFEQCENKRKRERMNATFHFHCACHRALIFWSGKKRTKTNSCIMLLIRRHRKAKLFSRFFT